MGIPIDCIERIFENLLFTRILVNLRNSRKILVNSRKFLQHGGWRGVPVVGHKNFLNFSRKHIPFRLRFKFEVIRMRTEQMRSV